MKSIVSISIALSVFILTSLNLNAQQKVVAVDSLIVEAVKKEVWTPFMESYRDLDFKKLESIHVSDITHVGVWSCYFYSDRKFKVVCCQINILET